MERVIKVKMEVLLEIETCTSDKNSAMNKQISPPNNISFSLLKHSFKVFLNFFTALAYFNLNMGLWGREYFPDLLRGLVIYLYIKHLHLLLN